MALRRFIRVNADLKLKCSVKMALGGFYIQKVLVSVLLSLTRFQVEDFFRIYAENFLFTLTKK